MAQLPNPYGPASPIGNSLSELMQTMFNPATSGIDPTKQAYNRAAAAKLRAETDILSGKDAAMSSIGNMTQDMISQSQRAAPTLSLDPTNDVTLPSDAGYFTSRMGDLTSAGTRAGMNPEQIGQLAFQTARQANLPADQVARFSPDFLPLNAGLTIADRDKMIADENVAKTNRATATERAKPHNIGEGDIALFPPGDPRGAGRVAGLPTINTQRGIVARDALAANKMTPVQSRILGGNPTPRNYAAPNGGQGITHDGVTDAQTGQLIPQGSTVFTGQLQAGSMGDLTKATTTQVQKETLAATRFKDLLTRTRTVAAADPTNFGVPGFVKGTAQDVQALANGISTGLGYTNAPQAVSEVRNKIARSGVDPALFSGVFDPALPALESMSDLLVFSAAETLAGQEGRSVSDRDVKMFKQIAGDPRSWMMSQEKYLAKLKVMEDIVDGRMGATQQFVDQNRGGRPAPQRGPQPGAVEDGFRFKGGNPADPNAWERAQ
jgi:hypothetical protein